MPYPPPEYAGDATYSIDTTSDCCAGDNVRFVRAMFAKGSRLPSHFVMITALIIKESYGAAKQQHTFTLELRDGTKSTIKGRNLYRYGVWRKPWSDEALRGEALDEKHNRGDNARATRDARRAGGY